MLRLKIACFGPIPRNRPGPRVQAQAAVLWAVLEGLDPLMVLRQGIVLNEALNGQLVPDREPLIPKGIVLLLPRAPNTARHRHRDAPRKLSPSVAKAAARRVPSPKSSRKFCNSFLLSPQAALKEWCPRVLYSITK